MTIPDCHAPSKQEKRSTISRETYLEANDMDCPKCDGTLHEIDSDEGVVLDFCQSCKGLWFDSGETSIYFEMATDLPDIEAASDGARATGFKCPKCRGDLEEIRFLPDEPLLLDRCRNCGGIWFDAGEVPVLERISKRIGTPRSKVLIAARHLERLGYEVIGTKISQQR